MAENDDIVVHAPDGSRHIVDGIAFPNLDIVFGEELFCPHFNKKIANIQMERIVVKNHTLGGVEISENPIEILHERFHNSGIVG
jgi:uncharacterized transporter YbjL